MVRLVEIQPRGEMIRTGALAGIAATAIETEATEVTEIMIGIIVLEAGTAIGISTRLSSSPAPIFHCRPSRNGATARRELSPKTTGADQISHSSRTSTSRRCQQSQSTSHRCLGRVVRWYRRRSCPTRRPNLHIPILSHSRLQTLW